MTVDPVSSASPHPMVSAVHRAAREPRELFQLGADVVDLLPFLPVGPTARPGESSYRDFLEALGVAVYTTDADGRITFFNEAAASFWGRRPELGEEWCGSWRLLWPDGSPMRHDECPMAVALRENRPVRGLQAIAVRSDGTRVTFIPYPTPLRDATGALVGAVNVLIDVTDLARAQEALRASNAVRDEFLGLVSHELRTPVTTIFGNALLLLERGDVLPEPKKQAMLADVAGESGRLLAIVENLLLLTRLDSGSRPELEPQILSHIVRNSIDAFRRRHPQRLVSRTSGLRHVIVEADRTYLELLMENLLGNADKYSPEGQPIEVALSVDDGQASVAVLDRGIGIGDDEAMKLFEPFYRTAAARATAGGLGIGLTVCKRAVEAQGGRIWARARDEGGMELGFSLPLAVDGH